ncbi:ABC transporter ATP-binding protein [Acidisphaera sp. L21]|uniref:ABC transporter ATP-binding protein n=1 Tax=Acidisphaera sp. L21 TaxID=1641851 RepID=UPI00131BE1D8|nr:ABC transporter ATP-binding protein [Acidisphaera sp. L21]
MSAVLDVQDLAVNFRGAGGSVAAVEGVSFQLQERETLAIVGESSSGKSVTALALMRLLGGAPGCVVAGRAMLRRADGAAVDLLALPEAQMAGIRGRDIGMIFQEPMTSLNPVHRIGDQIVEGLLAHERLSARAASARATELLSHVGIPEPALRARAYPHELSGGMRQRAMIAMALACRPRVLIADEPTTALDVTIQAQILDLIRNLQVDTGMSVIFITHNLGVVAQVADRVLVMYAGQVVEDAPVDTLMRRPLMPYSAGLIRSVPQLSHVRLRREGGRLAAIPGNVPDPQGRAAGCVFQPRCDHARPEPCEAGRPVLEIAASGHAVRCARWRDIAA